MTDDLIYNERVSSNRTEALFLALTILFFLLLIWRVNAGSLDILAAVFFFLFIFFFFYSVNYRTLIIRLTSKSLKLTFGIFTWSVPLDNVEACCLDDIPMLMRMGGAGIHFMSIRKRYRASFNFLEHPRVVIAFKRKVGLVRDISFSTRRPDDVLRLIQEAVSVKRAAQHGRPAVGPPTIKHNDNDEGANGCMGKIVNLHRVALEMNSSLWQISEFEGEPVLQVMGNKDEDYIGGKVALIGDVKRNYTMQAEMRFVGHHLAQERAGWFGFAMRAQDMLNYEIVWFMPNVETGQTVAYVPVAHGIVPWWTEAYASQKKGTAHIPTNSWFRARVDVVSDEFTLRVEDQIIFTKKLTYYLLAGRPGLYVGTVTDAMFRRIVIEDLP